MSDWDGHSLCVLCSFLCKEMKVGGEKKPMKISLHSSKLMFLAGTNVRIQDCIWNSSSVKQFKATDTNQTTGSPI